jgi:hypothetical protein
MWWRRTVIQFGISTFLDTAVIDTSITAPRCVRVFWALVWPLKPTRKDRFLQKGGFSLPGLIIYYCLLGLCGNSGPQKRFRNGRVTPQ